ncbi:MAG: ribonuclease III [Planctomycetota bacterium]|nr:ribonuclease III [Planctomycetota bacterium]
MTHNESNLSHLEDAIGYRFRQRNLLRRALKHSSHSDDHNERLEFLGDAVLDLIISGWLFDKFKNHREGHLTELKSMLVSRATLARVGKQLKLQPFIEIGDGLKGRDELPPSLLGNTVEAIIGAIYLDAPSNSVLTVCHDLILAWLQDEIANLPQNISRAQSKQRLQEIAQQHLSCLPEYRITEIASSGPSPTFKAEAIINGKLHGEGHGTSKKRAEQDAAWQALSSLSQLLKLTELDD